MKKRFLFFVVSACVYTTQAQDPYRASMVEYMRHTVFTNPTWVVVRPLEPANSHSVFARSHMGQSIELSNCTLHDTLQLYDDAQRLLGTWHEDAKGAPTRINLQPYPPGLYTLLRRSKGVVFRLEVERRM